MWAAHDAKPVGTVIAPAFPHRIAATALTQSVTRPRFRPASGDGDPLEDAPLSLKRDLESSVYLSSPPESATTRTPVCSAIAASASAVASDSNASARADRRAPCSHRSAMAFS